MRVLVCGGRAFSNKDFIFRSLELIYSSTNISTIIQGGATGADALAKEWAESKDIPCMEFPADWSIHGKAAGQVRNQQMIDEGYPDMIVAFAGGKGTENMMKLGVKHRIPVLEMIEGPFDV